MPSTATDRIDGLTTSVAVKAPCKAVSTTALTLSGEQTIGGVSCVDGDRVLYALSGGSVNNGIWVVSTGAWSRAKDFDGSRDVVKGTLVLVAPGTGDELMYRVNTSGTIVPGTTSISITEFSGDASNLQSSLASTGSSTAGAGLIGLDFYGDDLRTFLATTYARTAAEIATSVTPTNYAYPPGNVKRYGAVGDGSTDDTAAITAADTAACAGNLGLGANTVLAENVVYFPPGRYKVTALTYRGAPWVGAGIAVTAIDHYASSGACIDAMGTNGARKLLSIRDMSINGSNATGTAYGLRLGYNQRSFGALQRVRIDNFPGPAIYFDDPTWSMSFYDVYCSFNGADSLNTAIYHDPGLAEGTLLALDWFNLHLENNGATGSGKGGGIDLTSNAAFDWHFFGGVWEGNYGTAEAQFTNAVGMHIHCLYLEAEAASVANGLVFAGSTNGSVTNSRIAGESGMTGDGINITGTAVVHIEHIYSNINWVNDISVAGTARVTAEGYNAALLFSVANGATLARLTPTRAQLTDAATIAIDASDANSFYVTLGGNRTVGAPTNPSLGQQITLLFIQDATGGRTVTFNAVFKVTWSDTGNTANKRSSIVFEYDGTNWNQVGGQSPYV